MYDAVKCPKYYNLGKIQVIDFIEDQNLGFSLGNAIKYIVRAGKKDPSKHIEDLCKAKQYIDMEILKIEKRKAEIHENNTTVL